MAEEKTGQETPGELSPEEEKKRAIVEDKEAQEAADKSTDMISQANAAAIRIEEANKKQEEINTKTEQLKVQQTLGGQAEAGAAPKEETPEEYKNKIMSGEIRGTQE